MSTDPERDPLTDRLLREALQPQDPAGSDGCVDPEMLAAWADGGLPAAQAADVEAHLAGCARCQAMLGVFANVDESRPAVPSVSTVIPFKPKSPLRWMLPLAASLAATVLLWTAVRNREAAAGPETTMAKAESPRPAPMPAPVPPRAEVTLPASPAPMAERRAAATKSASAAATANDATKPVAIPAPATMQTQGAAAAPPPATGAQAQAALAQPPLTPPAAIGSVASREVTLLRADAEPVRSDAAAASSSKVIAEFAPPAAETSGLGRAFAGGGRGGGGGGRASALPTERVTPRVRWRVLASGQVMKSTNDDTWVPITITPTVFILNGHAPSPTVCWLVGRAGIIELSTDGTKFTRVKFPDVSDLRSITAIDAHQATVTTTDGRVFTTVDGGDSWEPKKIDSRCP